MAASRWGTYACYPYVFGVGRELHEIPLHTCGSEIAAFEQLARVQRENAHRTEWEDFRRVGDNLSPQTRAKTRGGEEGADT